MANAKKTPTIRKPLPVRVVFLHAKLAIATVVGVLTILLAPSGWHLPTRLLAGWDVGVALYLIQTHTMFWRADVEKLHRRAKEQDEGEFIILLLTMGATLASIA